MEELVLHFGIEGGEEKIFRISVDGTTMFIKKFSFMKFDLDDWDGGEKIIPSFESYWSSFTLDPKWYRLQPVLVHMDIKPTILESLQKIDLKTLSKYEKTKIEDWVRVLSKNQYLSDYDFKRNCRNHQSRFRSEVLKVWFDRYINVLLDEDGKKGMNFYSGFYIFSSVKNRYPGFRKPLYCNLLRSEHIPFNFFIPLDRDKEFGKQVFNEILGGIIEQITLLKIEYPEIPPSKYLDDRTSFDTYIEYRHVDGSEGILGIEVKYTERSYELKNGSKEKRDVEDETSLYYRRSCKSGVFQKGILSLLKQDDYRQVWRNQLLGESILIEDKPKYSHFHSLTFYPEGNIHFTEVISGYQELLKPEYRDRVQGVTYERFFKICRKYLPNEEFIRWLEYLERRYICL
ncbi:MAG: hypothetical protein FJY10_04910 [Bacteroidetes bacterium]|nr:hypothetical protein [Bacteroidota bacterium]